MTIKEILEKKKVKHVWTIKSDASVMEAVHVLNSHKIGALMVVDDAGKPVGIITERDIMYELNARFEALPTLKVADVMTADPICGKLNQDINYIMNVMNQNRIRHLPIFDQGKLIGMISLGDVVGNLLDKMQVENHMMQDYLQLAGKL